MANQQEAADQVATDLVRSGSPLSAKMAATEEATTLMEVEFDKEFAQSQSMKRSAILEYMTTEKAKKIERMIGHSSRRRLVSSCVLSCGFDGIMNCVILTNLATAIQQANLRARGEPFPLWLDLCGHIFLAFYSVELVLKLYAWRCAFFEEWENIVDFFVVVADVSVTLFELLSTNDGTGFSISVLRLLRLMRLLRAFHIFHRCRELMVMLAVLASTFRSVFYGVGLMFIMLILWSIIAVEMLHPLAKQVADDVDGETAERIVQAYDSVGRAFLTFLQQVVIADDWGTISMPLLYAFPLSAGPILVCVFVSCQVALLNLVLMAIVDSAHEFRLRENASADAQRSREFLKAKQDLLEVCQQIDTDDSGTLDLQELINGFENNELMQQCLTSIDAKHNDILAVYNVLDADAEGCISYTDFIDHLHSMKLESSKSLLVFMKSEIISLQKNLQSDVCMLKEAIMSEHLEAMKDLTKMLPRIYSQMLSVAGAKELSPLDKTSLPATQNEVQTVEGLVMRKVLTPEQDSRFSDPMTGCKPGMFGLAPASTDGSLSFRQLNGGLPAELLAL